MFAKSVHHKNKNKPKSQAKQKNPIFTCTQDAVGIRMKLYANKLPYIFASDSLQQHNVCWITAFRVTELSLFFSEGGLERLAASEHHFLPELIFYFVMGI